MGYRDFKELNRRTFDDKVLRDINLDLLQWFINFLIKELLVVVLKIKIFMIKNYSKNYTNQLLETLIKDKYTIDMKLLSKFNKRFRFLLRIIDIYSKYALTVPLKDKKPITINNVFQKLLDESNCKPNNI